MTQDLRSKDQAAKDRIEFLDDHCSNLEVEILELQQVVKSLLVENKELRSNQEFCL